MERGAWWAIIWGHKVSDMTEHVSIQTWERPQAVLVVKNLPANAGDLRDVGLIPGSGRSLGGGHGNPLHYSCLENSMDRGAWRATVHGVTEWTQLKWLSMHACMHLVQLHLCPVPSKQCQVSFKIKNKLMCIKHQQRKQKIWVTEKLTQFNCFKIGIPQWFVTEIRIQIRVRRDITTPKR